MDNLLPASAIRCSASAIPRAARQTTSHPRRSMFRFPIPGRHAPFIPLAGLLYLACLSPLLAVPAADNDIRDIKSPVPIPTAWEWLPHAMAALAGLALLYLLFRRLRRNPEAPAPLIVPPHVRARNRLRQALDLIDQAKPFCILISDTLRLYLEERFHYHAPDRTTEEFLDELRASDTGNNLGPAQKQLLREFLTRCDLVKFARQTPAKPELRELLDSALLLVEQTAPSPAEPAGAGARQTSNPEPAVP